MANLKPSTTNRYTKTTDDGKKHIDIIISFLQIFLPEQSARRLVCAILLAAGLPSSKAGLLAGVRRTTVQSTGRALLSGNITSIFVRKNGGGRKSKIKSVEQQILDELETQEYRTQQQIADMIQEKFHISISTQAVRRLLKKTALKD